MKIINETLATHPAGRGRHAVTFFAEDQNDKRIVAQIFDVFERTPRLRAEMIRAAGDRFPSLRLEEREA